MTKPLTLLLHLLLWFGLAQPIWAATVTAQVDTHKVQQGDSLILTITVNERAFGKEPNFDELKEQFRIINKVNSSSVRMINGRMESSISWRLTLAPKVNGYVVIPPIKYGNSQTKPITIQVAKRSASNKPTSKDLVFIEATVDKKSVYVQEQVILTLRLYKRTQLIDASWTPPQISDAVSEPLTESRTYQSVVGNYTYQVTENTFAIFPQKSGELLIPKSHLIATIGTGRRGGFFDPFGSAGKQISRSTKALSVEVKSIPDGYPKTHWLPSSAVAMADQWSPENPEFKVGEAVTRTIILQAKGLTATALPSIPAPSSNKFKVYPDKADTKSTVDADGIVSQRVESYAFIPTEAGTITLPEIQISWWDVTRDKLQMATLPAKTITVEPSASAQKTDQAVTAPPSISAPPSTVPPSVSNTQVTAPNSMWQWIAMGSLILWLITLPIIFIALKRKPNKEPPQETQVKAPRISLKEAKAALKSACQGSDPRQVRDALINWGTAIYPSKNCYSIGDVKNNVTSEKCRAAIKELEIVLYKSGEAPGNQHWDSTLLWEAAEEEEAEVDAGKANPALAPLYPSSS